MWEWRVWGMFLGICLLLNDSTDVEKTETTWYEGGSKPWVHARGLDEQL